MLELDALCCRRDDLPLFEPVTVRVAAGDQLTVRGPNGVGKSTLLRAVAQLYGQHDGAIRWDGRDVATDATPLLTALLYVGHDLGVTRDLPVAQHLGWLRRLAGPRWQGGDDPNRLLAAVALAGYEDVPVRRLSAGQQRRLALLRLLALRARLWVLDEPYTALDAAGADLLADLTARHCAAGGLCLVAAHQGLPDARELWLEAADPLAAAAEY